MPYQWIPDFHLTEKDAHLIDSMLTELLRHVSDGSTRFRSVSEYLAHDEQGRVAFDKLVETFLWAQKKETWFPDDFEAFTENSAPIALCHVMTRDERINGKYRLFSLQFGKTDVPTLVSASAGHTINVDLRALAKQVFDSANHKLPDFIEHATYFGALDSILNDGVIVYAQSAPARKR